MKWVPEDQRDTAWYLFNVKFMCRVPYIESRSAEDIKMFGMPHTGISEYDTQTVNELVHRLLSIAEILEYYDKGVTVYVTNMPDTKKIYDLIRNHLLSWEAALQRAFNTKGAPVDDLIRLDKLAQALYAHAKPFITDDNRSLFAKGLTNFSNRRGITRNAPPPVKKTDAPEDVQDEKPYESLGKVFVAMRRQRG